MKVLVVVAGMAVAGWPTQAEGWSPAAVGLHYGMSATGLSDLYWQLEPVVRWELPCEGGLGHGWRISTWCDASVGWLASRGDHGVVGTLGPVVRFDREGWITHFEGGLSPTLMSRNKYGEDDFGTAVQFTTHLGVLVDVTQRWSVGYRWQHMSNAHLADDNPGLNLHMLTVHYRF